MNYGMSDVNVVSDLSRGLGKGFLSKCAASITLALLISAPGHTTQLIPLDSFPKWFKDAAARNVDVKKQSKIKIPELGIDGQVYGKASLNTTGDNFWYFTIDIGTDVPVECYVFTAFDGPSNSLYGVVRESLKSVETIYKKPITNTMNYSINVGVIDSAPYLSLDTFYSAGEGSEMVSGVLKAMSALSGDNLQICLHNELGYEASFEKVYTSFVSAFEQAQAKDEFYSVIYKLSINGMPMGFGSEKMSKDQDGDVYSAIASSMLVPVDASNVSRADSMASEWSTPDGNLINQNKYSVENGALSMQFDVSWVNDAWNVEGQLQGKDVAFTLEHKESISSLYGSYLETVKLLQSDDESSEIYMWNELNPSAIQTVVSTKLKDRDDANIQTNYGPLVIESLSNEYGVPQSGTIKQGPALIKLDLMTTSGLPVLP